MPRSRPRRGSSSTDTKSTIAGTTESGARPDRPTSLERRSSASAYSKAERKSGIQPSPIDAARTSAASDDPPTQIGTGDASGRTR